MVRQEWLNLNGLWDLAITSKEAKRATFDTQILVPFPVESALSGVMRPVSENDRIWYRRTFDVPAKWHGRRLLLHFGAVDFETTVWVNGKEIGQHRGGYDAFSFDITDALNPSGAERVGRDRLGPDRRRHPAPRQAGAQAQRHLVHVHQRHLADGLAGAGQCRLHHGPEDHAGCGHTAR